MENYSSDIWREPKVDSPSLGPLAQSLCDLRIPLGVSEPRFRVNEIVVSLRNRILVAAILDVRLDFQTDAWFYYVRYTSDGKSFHLDCWAEYLLAPYGGQ